MNLSTIDIVAFHRDFKEWFNELGDKSSRPMFNHCDMKATWINSPLNRYTLTDDETEHLLKIVMELDIHPWFYLDRKISAYVAGYKTTTR